MGVESYTLGRGMIYFDRKQTDGTYLGEVLLGNAPEFSFSVAVDKLEHFSSMGGLKAKDKQVISQITPSCKFTLDEINADTLSLLTLASKDDKVITQTAVVAPTTVTGEVVASVTAGDTIYLTKRGLVSITSMVADDTPDVDMYDSGNGSGVFYTALTDEDKELGRIRIIKTSTVLDADPRDITITYVYNTPIKVGEVTDQVVGGHYVFLQNRGITAITSFEAEGSHSMVEDTDYTMSAEDAALGRIYIIKTSTNLDAVSRTLTITYKYNTPTYQNINVFSDTTVEGMLHYVSDNPVGNQTDIKMWSVSLTPSGDTSLIGTDWAQISFEGEILKDELGHPTSPYFDVTVF